MGKIAIDQAPVRAGTAYPPPYDKPCLDRHRTRLGDAAGLTQFGVNLLRLPPGVWRASVIGMRPRTSSSISSRVRSCW